MLTNSRKGRSIRERAHFYSHMIQMGCIVDKRPNASSAVFGNHTEQAVLSSFGKHRVMRFEDGFYRISFFHIFSAIMRVNCNVVPIAKTKSYDRTNDAIFV